MREYKFRGKTEDDMIFEDGKMIDKGTWVYGSLIVNSNLPYIVGEVIESDSEYIALEYWYPCDVNTIGQFTGLHDKNGKKIYEGDVVRIVNNYSEATKKTHGNVVVKFKDGSFIVTWDVDGDEHYNHFTSYNTPVVTFEVIGNIHDKGETE